MKNCESCPDGPVNNPAMRGKPYRETPCARCENAQYNDRFSVTDPCADFHLRDWQSAPEPLPPGPSVHWCKLHIRKLRDAGKLDSVDLKIIHLRQAYPMPSNRSVSKKIHLSEHAVRYRIKKIAAMF